MLDCELSANDNLPTIQSKIPNTEPESVISIISNEQKNLCNVFPNIPPKSPILNENLAVHLDSSEIINVENKRVKLESLDETQSDDKELNSQNPNREEEEVSLKEELQPCSKGNCLDPGCADGAECSNMREWKAYSTEVNTGCFHCAACTQTITDPYLLFTLDRYWHLSCLLCAVCRRPLEELGATCFTKDGLILCRYDYDRFLFSSLYTTSYLYAL